MNDKKISINQNFKCMKKYLFLLAVVGALASCSSNEVFDESHSMKNDNAITFNTMRDKVGTRYANDNKTDYQVYAVIGGLTTWFIDNTVTPSTNTDTSDTINPPSGSTSTPIYHWPGNDTFVYFFAYAPAEISATTGITSVDAKTGTTSGDLPTIDIAYTVPTNADMDFTIAKPLKQDQGSVSFSFQHMLSQINVSAVLSDELLAAGYTLGTGYAATVKVPYNTSTIDAAYDYTTTTPKPVWGSLSTSTGSALTYSGKTSYNVMPQTTTECSIQLTGITITGSSGGTVLDKGAVKVYNIESTLVDNFVMGYAYNFTFTISSSSNTPTGPIFNAQITFTSSVDGWVGSSVAVDQP